MLDVIKKASLQLVQKGSIVASSTVTTESILESNSVCFFVIRRPGWQLCREEALDIAQMFKSRASLFSNVSLIGIIKEVAPLKNVATDKELGVEDFQENYFLNFPVYIDSEKTFYKALGNKSLLSQKLSTWNPFQLYSDFKSLGNRLKAKNINGNLVGEGLIKGGIIVVSKNKGVVASFPEETGSLLPLERIEEAIKNV